MHRMKCQLNVVDIHIVRPDILPHNLYVYRLRTIVCRVCTHLQHIAYIFKCYFSILVATYRNVLYNVNKLHNVLSRIKGKY